MPKILVIYFSKTNHTKKMAEEIYDELKNCDAKIDLVDVSNLDYDSIPSYDAYIIGSPNYFGTMAAEIKLFFDKSVRYFKKLEGKVAAAFTSAGMIGGGGDAVVLDILKACLVHGMVVKGETRIGHFGPVAIGDPDERALKECRFLAKDIYELTQKLNG